MSRKSLHAVGFLKKIPNNNVEYYNHSILFIPNLLMHLEAISCHKLQVLCIKIYRVFHKYISIL